MLDREFVFNNLGVQMHLTNAFGIIKRKKFITK